jgi:peroxiredoxin Q/BCP
VLLVPALKVGDKAPEFDVTASDGKRLKLADFLGKKNVVLYFYPKDGTMVCTAEACGFRDMYEDLMAGDTEVIGVSTDTDESHKAFSGRYGVPFPLIADVDKSLSAKYGATGGFRELIGGGVKRITYVIDKQGIIRGVFDSALRASNHLDGVKAAVEKLRAG